MERGAGVRGSSVERIARPRLVGLAREALERGSLLITAPAGYGKTTLLEQVVDESSGPSVWIRCTTADLDPGALVAKLIEAISGSVPGAVGDLAERLDRLPGPADARAVASELRAELDRLLVEPLVVVVDEAETLAGGTASCSLLGDLVRVERSSVRVAIATRRPLALRIAKPRAGGRLVELTSANLGFTVEETEDLVRSRRGAPCDPEEVERMVEITQGWPLGLALLAASPHGGALTPGPVADPGRDQLHAYLAEEILDSLEPDLREAAIASSVAATVTPEVAEALNLPNGMLGRLASAGLPARVDRASGALAYHPLVRDLMRERLAADGADRVRSLHARVAPAIAASGDSREAADHLVAAEAWDELAALLDGEGMRIARTSPELVRSWLEHLPPESANNPGVRLLQGQLHWGAGDHPRAKEALEAAAEGMRARGDGREWMVRLMLFDAAGSGGDIEGALAAIAGIEEALGEAGGPFVAAAARHVAMALATFGRREESDRLDDLARRHPEAEAIVSLGSVREAVIGYLHGDLDEAIAQLAAEVRDTSRPDPLNLRFYVWQSLTRILDAAGRDAEAIATWRSMEGELGEALAPYAARGGNHVQAKLHARAGRLEEARARLAAGGPAERGWRAQDRELAVAWVAALEGDTDGVAEAARRVIELQPIAPPLIRTESAIDLVPPLVLAGDLERAHAVAEQTLRMIDATFAGQAPFPKARLLALRAWTAHTAGDLAGSERDLVAMWTGAGEARRHILRRERGRLLPLVSSALERGVLDPGEAVASFAAASVGGSALAELTRHRSPAVRRAAIRPALASGDPQAVRRLAALGDDPDPEVAAAARAARADLAAAVPPLRFQVLGDFTVERGGWRIPDRDWGRPAASRLVRFLLVAYPEPLPAEAIAEALWGDLAPKSARGSLQVAVSRARHALDLPGTKSSVIDSADGAYRLDLGERGSIDAVEFERAAQAALAARGGERIRLLERARGFWGGQPLPSERYEEWTLAWRVRLIDCYVDVLGELISAHGGRAEHSRAIGAARELIELDPLNEGGHRALMAAYARAGRTGQALHQYLECRRLLVDELGIEPSTATSRLQARILTGEPV